MSTRPQGPLGPGPLGGLLGDDREVASELSPQGEKKMRYLPTFAFLLLAKGCFWGVDSSVSSTSTVCCPGALWGPSTLTAGSQVLHRSALHSCNKRLCVTSSEDIDAQAEG